MAEAAVPIAHRIQSLSAVDAVGKHRLLAEMKRLEQEARFLEVVILFYFLFFLCSVFTCLVASKNF